MTIWGTCSPTPLQALERIHTRAARIIHNLPDNLNSTEILKNAHWQPFSKFYKRKLTALIYSVYYNLAPKPICDLFTRNTAHHSTRKALRAILCKNQTKWEMKNFDPALKFACK